MNLNNLYDPNFHALLAVYSTPDALYRALNRSEVIQKLKFQYSVNALTNTELEIFVTELLGSFEPGKYFPNQIQLAAITVLVSSKPNEFTNDLLKQFAKLQVSGLPMFPRIAEICLDNQTSHLISADILRFNKCVPEIQHISSEETPWLIDVALPQLDGVLLLGQEREACAN